MNLLNYFKFIDDCKEKHPEKYHKHHIIPKYMGGSNEEDNLINLSYEDHYNAHIILAECFEAGSYHYNRNIWSALRLIGWKKDENLSNKLSLARKGKTYDELFVDFTSDYDRENPVTKNEGMMRIMEKKIQSAKNEEEREKLK